MKTHEFSEMNIDGVFILIGYIPNTEMFEDIVELTDRKEIIASRDMETNIPGVFAAGDCTAKKYRQVTTAVADGGIWSLTDPNGNVLADNLVMEVGAGLATTFTTLLNSPRLCGAGGGGRTRTGLLPRDFEYKVSRTKHPP